MFSHFPPAKCGDSSNVVTQVVTVLGPDSLPFDTFPANVTVPNNESAFSAATGTPTYGEFCGLISSLTYNDTISA